MSITAEDYPRRGDSLRKRDAILEAAGALFIEQGFGNTSVDAVASRAGVSKATVYAHFANKNALFEAVIKLRCASVVPPSLENIDPHDEGMEIVLRRLGLLFLENIYTPGQIRLLRAIIAESVQFPEIGRMMFEGPVLRSQNLVSVYLERQCALGRVTLECADLAAAQFLGLLKTDLQMRLLFNQPVDISSANLRRIADCSVALFLNGCAPKLRNRH